MEGPSVCLTFLGIELDIRKKDDKTPTIKQVDEVRELDQELATEEGLQSQGVAVLGGETAACM